MRRPSLTIKDVTKGIMARVMFGVHGLLGVLLATMVTKNHWYWFLALLIPLGIVEGATTIKCKKKWNCIVPCIVLYMCLVVPALIMMELQLDMLDTRQVDMMMSNVSKMSMPEMHMMISMPTEHQPDREALKSLEINDMSLLENNSVLPIPVENMYGNMNISNQSLEMWLRMKVAWLCPEDSGCNWDDTLQMYKQSFIFVLIIGCWIDPMTILRKNEKAELLLINIGVASDVLEFLEMANDVRKKLKTPLIDVPYLLPMTLFIWTWSLLQFTLIAKPKYVNRTVDLSSIRFFAHSVFWEVFITLFLMDIPYLVFRLVMIFHFGCVNKSIIFFSARNLLIIIIQFYRLYAVKADEHESNNSHHNSTEMQRLPTDDA